MKKDVLSKCYYFSQGIKTIGSILQSMFFHSLFKRHYVALATAYQTDERGVSEMEQQPADVHSDLQTFIRLRKAELTPFNLQCIGIFFIDLLNKY